MYKYFYQILLLLAISALSGTYVYSQSVSAQIDQITDFSGFKTYSLIRGTPPSNPMIDKRISDGIKLQLIAKGLRLVDKDSKPDLFVIYHAGCDDNTNIVTYNTIIWADWNWGIGKVTHHYSRIKEGNLVIDLADTRTKRFVWRSYAKDTISNNAEIVDKSLNKALMKMFKKLPIGR